MMFKTFETFVPRKVEDKQKHLTEQHNIIDTMVDETIIFNQLSFLEWIPVDKRDSMASDLQNTFLASIENININFTAEELKILDRYEINGDKYAMINDDYTLCKLPTHSEGVRFMLNMFNKIFIFKQGVDLTILSKALIYIE